MSCGESVKLVTVGFFVAAALVTVRVSPALADEDPTARCVAATERGLALQRDRKWILARQEFAGCDADGCGTEIREACRSHIAEIEAAMPTVVFVGNTGAAASMGSVRVWIDGVAYSGPLDGTPIALDPGEHELRFEAEGQPPIVRRVALMEGEKNRRETIDMGSTVPASSSAPEVSVARPCTEPPSPPSPAATGGAKAQRAIGSVLTGLGIASLALGALAGAAALAMHASYEQNCGSNIGAPSGYCNANGVRGEAETARMGDLATYLIIGGGAGLAGGILLRALAPKAPNVALGPGTLFVGGRF